MACRKTRGRPYARPAVLRLDTFEPREVPATWPVPDSHEMGFSFGTGSLVSTFRFHEGLDIMADGKGGQKVVAVRDGTVFWKDAAWLGGYLVIEVDVGGGKTEWDAYLHIS